MIASVFHRHCIILTEKLFCAVEFKNTEYIFDVGKYGYVKYVHLTFVILDLRHYFNNRCICYHMHTLLLYAYFIWREKATCHSLAVEKIQSSVSNILLYVNFFTKASEWHSSSYWCRALLKKFQLLFKYVICS